MLIVMGDFNAKIGNLKTEEFLGTFSEETCDNNGNRLIDFMVQPEK